MLLLARCARSAAITPTKQIFSLAETSSQEIFELIQKIPGNKASGLDNISARLLKEAAPVVTPSLTYITRVSKRY